MKGPSYSAIAMLMAMIVATPPDGWAQEGGSPPEVDAAHQMLAAILGVEPAALRVTVEGAPLPFHTGAILTVAETAGMHAPVRAAVATLPNGWLLPLGCASARRVLQTLAPPAVPSDSLPQYVAVLAWLDGRVPIMASPVTDTLRLSTWMLDRMRERGIEPERPTVREMPNGLREVSLLVLSRALQRVVAVVGDDHVRDGIARVELLVGYPPGGERPSGR